MPYYDYRCHDCGATFEIRRSMSAHIGTNLVKCTDCDSSRTDRVYTPIAVGTSGAAIKSDSAGASCGTGCGCHMN